MLIIYIPSAYVTVGTVHVPNNVLIFTPTVKTTYKTGHTSTYNGNDTGNGIQSVDTSINMTFGDNGVSWYVSTYTVSGYLYKPSNWGESQLSKNAQAYIYIAIG